VEIRALTVGSAVPQEAGSDAFCGTLEVPGVSSSIGMEYAGDQS